MKPKKYLHSLIGISTLFVACNLSAAATEEGGPSPYLLFENGTQSGSLSIDREGDRVPHYRWGVFEVPPADVPATDSKGAVVKKADDKSPMAPSVANERWEVFASAFWFTEKVDQQTTRFIPANDTDIWGVNAGARYRINDAWSVGGMVGYGDGFIDMKWDSIEFAKVKVDTWTFTPFVNFEQKNLVAGADFEAQLQYTYGSQEYRNNILGLVGDRGGNFNAINLTTGLVWSCGDLHHGPVVGVRYIDAHVDRFNLGPLPFTSSVDDSLASIVGYELSYDIKLAGGKIVPAISASWEHEYRADVNNVFAGVPNGTIDKDIAVVDAGIGFYANCGWNLVVDYEARLNNASNSSFVGLKVGKSF